MSLLRESFDKFKNLMEKSPLEGPVMGFNRHLRDMSPVTRDLVLKGHSLEIDAFANDRRLDPNLIKGIAEASMRLGRIPDLHGYGLYGDDALAVKHFMADTILNLAEQVLAISTITEEDNKKARHLKLASDYKKLAEFHKRRSKEEADKAKIAKDDGRPHSSIRANSSSEEHKHLASHCSGLADWHQLKANEIPAVNRVKAKDDGTEDKNISPPQNTQVAEASEDDDKEPGKLDSTLGSAVGAGLGGYVGGAKGAQLGKTIGGAIGVKGIGTLAKTALNPVASGMKAFGVAKTAFKSLTGGNKAPALPKPAPVTPKKPEEPKEEQTLHTNIGSVVKPFQVKVATQPQRPNSLLPPAVNEKDYVNKWHQKKEMRSGMDLPTEKKNKDKGDVEQPEKIESFTRFRKAELLDDLLTEKKVEKKAAKKEGDCAKKNIGPLFQALGQKMDADECKENAKFKAHWAKDLYATAMKDGGAAAAEAVIKHSMNNAWVKDNGYVDEAMNLRHNWETEMSKETLKKAEDPSPLKPEPGKEAINRMISMSSK